MNVAEIFVVRIYRRSGGARGEVTGIVDVIAAGTRHAFCSFDELSAILRTETRARNEALLLVVPSKPSERNE